MTQDTLSPSPVSTPTSTKGWVSMRHLQQASVLASAAGLGIGDLLNHAGVLDNQLTDAEQTVPLQAVEVLLDALQRQYGDQSLGLHMALHIQPTTLGAIGHLLQACTTFADLIDVVVRHNGLLSNIGQASVFHLPGLVELRWKCLTGSPLLRHQATDYVIGTFVMLTRLLTQGCAPGGAFPAAVRLDHPRPQDPDKAKAYFSFFGCPVHFDQPHAAVVVPVALLPMRLPFGDATIKVLLEQHTARLLTARAQQGRTSTQEDVRRLIRGMILASDPAKEAVAQQLGISTRSLHRRLQEAGTSYRELLHAERATLACERLLGSDLPVTEIARMLGFCSPQAFLRWFRSIHGVTPAQYRRQSGKREEA